MTRLLRWLAALPLWIMVRAWRRLSAPTLHHETVLHVQVLALRSTRDGTITYRLTDGEGRPASALHFSGLMLAASDLGSTPGLDQDVRKACRKLGTRMRELQLLAMARATTAPAPEAA